MESKTLIEIESKLKARLPRIRSNEDYVEGKNPYILNKTTDKKPDNRIPVALAKMAVEDMAGYAGRSGDIVTDYEHVSSEGNDSEDMFIDYMRAMDSYNHETIETAELYEEVLIQGKAYEIWWASDELSLEKGLNTAEYKIVPAGSVYLNYSDDIKKALEYAVYFSGEDKEQRADVYFPLKQEIWKKKRSSNWIKEPEDIEHPYTTVPVNVFTGNRRECSLFDAEKPLIDAFDELISKSLNEVDRYNALMLLLGDEVDAEFVKKYTEGKISVIDDLGDAERTDLPRYLEKNLGGVNQFYNDLTDRVEALFHKSVKIPDMSDESFAGNASGVAIAFKLIGMEFKASQIETYFNQGLIRRLSFYADIYNASTKSISKDDYKATIKATRNVPMDLKAKAEIAQILMPIVSKETLLKFLPKNIVDDVEKELQKLEDQQPTDVLGLTSTGDTGLEGTDLEVIEDSDVDAVVLNGAQVTAAKEIAKDVAAGEMTKQQGLALLKSLGIPLEQAQDIVGGASIQ